MKNAGVATATISNDAITDVIMHHLNSFSNNDLDALMSDYTSNSVLITQDATYKGREEIKGFFEFLVPHFPNKRSAFELDKLVTNNELAYIVWHATTPSLEVILGTDTFIIKNDKILLQTFAGLLKFL